MEQAKQKLVIELTVVTAALVIVSSLLYFFRSIALVGEFLSAIIAVLFLYVPTIVLWKSGRPLDFLDRDFKAYVRSLLTFFVVAFIVFVPFFFLAHFWMKLVFHAGEFHLVGIPGGAQIMLFQLVMIALPEEFFFRGYFQATIDRVLEKKWNVLGVKLGWGWILTSLVFAFAHSVITVKWWHFSIFFPALLFGYLRERTGSITVSVLMHAACNFFAIWLTRSYY